MRSRVPVLPVATAGRSVTQALSGPLAGRGDLSAIELESAYALPGPALRANFVLSVDGVIALDGKSGGLGGPADREVFATLRALCDVVLVGAGTARAEGYGPAWLSAERRARRVERGQSPLPTVAVVTSGGGLDPASRLFTEHRDDQPDAPRPLVLTSQAAPAERIEALRQVATVVVAGDEQVEVSGVMAHLAGYGSGSVLCEGGPGLLSQLAAADLVDDLCLTYGPLLAGPGHRVLAGGPGDEPWDAPRRLELVQVLEGDGLLLTRWARATTVGEGG